MIWIILRKELLHHIMTTRVFIFFIISTGLFIVNGITFVRSYKSDLEIYSTRQAKLWSDRNTTGTYVLKQPNPLEFCVEGNAHIRPQALSIKLDGTISSGWRSEYENFKLPKVRRIDWSFIIQTIYALFCVVLTFDAISDERAKGTLRLMASNPVSRAQILLGKYLAVLIITFIVLLIGGLLSLSIINLLGVTVPTRADFAPLMLFGLLSMLYISLFIGMSLLVSTLARTSPTSLLLLLFIVIVLVFVVPNMAGITSGKLVNALTDYEARARSDAVINEHSQAVGKFYERIRNGTLKEKDEIIKQFQQPSRLYWESLDQIDRDYERGLARKQEMAETLARISPSAVFQATAESVANSGSSLQKRLRRTAERYQSIYLDYVKSKVGEIIPRFQMAWTIHLPDKTKVDIPEMKPKSYGGDMSDFPSFTYPQPSTQERLQDALFDIALLVLWNIACFMGAHLIFLKREI
jgi:ABC-2 type transport system permease protein